MSTKNTPKQLGIVEIAAMLDLQPGYVRTAIRKGKLETTMVPRSEGSEVMKHVATPEAVKAWRDNVGQGRTTREDGRNRFVFYATQEELDEFKAWQKESGNEAIVQKPNYRKANAAKA